MVILSGQPWYHIHRIMIIGCGNTGLALARELEGLDLPPTIIEMDHRRAEMVAGLLPRSLVLHGDGSDPEFLKHRLEEGQIDAVVVLLEKAEKSVLISIFAKSLGARKVVVRCDELGYIPLAHKLGVDAALSPKRAMTDTILRYVRRGTVASTLLLGEHEAEVIQFRVPDRPARGDLVRKPLSQLDLPKGVLVSAVIRDGNALIASGSMVLQPGDELLVAFQAEALGRLEKLFS